MRLLIILYICFYVLCISCNPFTGSASKSLLINDTTESFEKRIQVDINDGSNVTKIKVSVKGNVKGNLKINDIMLKTGQVDTIILAHDWYENYYDILCETNDFNGDVNVSIEFLYLR